MLDYSKQSSDLATGMLSSYFRSFFPNTVLMKQIVTQNALHFAKTKNEKIPNFSKMSFTIFLFLVRKFDCLIQAKRAA